MAKRNQLENPIYTEMEEKLNEIGPGMCLAKWTQVTLQLQTGHNHSCHHPRTHKINPKEIARNPSALHNTKYKKLRRREMLTGKKLPIKILMPLQIAGMIMLFALLIYANGMDVIRLFN